MKIQNILEAKEEAKRFLKKLKEVEDNQFKKGVKLTYTSKETGALKRASMDLTRSLSKMRNNIYD